MPGNVIPAPERARPVYTVNEPACMPADQVVVAVTAPPVGPGDLEALLRSLLPSAPVQTLPPHPVPTEMEILLERLLSKALELLPTLPPRTAITGMETLLLHLLPGTRTQASRPLPVPARRDWTRIVCFSCGKPGYGVGRCPELGETFPYMLPGWSAEKVGANYMISPRVAAERLQSGNGH